MKKDSPGKKRDTRLPISRQFLSLWITPWKRLFLSPLTTPATPDRSLLIEKPNFGTRSCACVWPGVVTGPAATWWTNYTHSLHEAMASNQKDTENSLRCQNPAEQSQKIFPRWVGTVRQPMQRVHSSIINSRYAAHGLVWVAYLQLLLPNLLLLWECCLPTALWGHIQSQWLLSSEDWISSWIKLATKPTPSEVLWRSVGKYICFNGYENCQPGVENEYS